MELIPTLNAYAKQIPVIDSNRNYWLVRTGSGEYYQNFIDGKYIALSYDEIRLSVIKALLSKKGGRGSEALSKIIKKTYLDEKRPGYVVSQLQRFVFEIKKGDIVIIPSKNSTHLYFGEVLDSNAYELQEKDDCPFLKRKKVKWIKHIQKRNIEAELYKLIFSHIAISNANNYAIYIDRILHDLYTKGNKTHLVIDVKTKNKINVDTFYDFGELFRIVEDICQEEKIVIKDFNIKSKVQSPGYFEITAITAIGALTIGLILVAIAGGGFKFKASFTKEKKELNAEFKTDGILEKIRFALNSKSRRKERAKIVESAIKKMKIESPEDLVKIIDKMNDKT